MKIILIEDDAIYAEFIGKSLQNADRQIQHFISAEEALEFIERNEVNAIIIDYKLPGMSGMDFFLQIREKIKRTAGIKAIMMSALDDGRMVLTFIQKGIRDYVIKDEYVVDSLLAILEGRENEMLFYETGG